MSGLRTDELIFTSCKKKKVEVQMIQRTSFLKMGPHECEGKIP
jgi:hypothetical protein